MKAVRRKIAERTKKSKAKIALHTRLPTPSRLKSSSTNASAATIQPAKSATAPTSEVLTEMFPSGDRDEPASSSRYPARDVREPPRPSRSDKETKPNDAAASAMTGRNP